MDAWNNAMSAWLYDGENNQHVYYWEGYRGYVSWEPTTKNYMGSVWLGNDGIKCRDFDNLIAAAVWCGDVMWDDWNASAAMHEELAAL